MPSIFAADELKNYFISRGFDAATADVSQTAVLAWETAGYFTAKDPSMISAVTNLARYGAGLFTDPVAKLAFVNLITGIIHCLRHFAFNPIANADHTLKTQGMLEYVAGTYSPADVNV